MIDGRMSIVVVQAVVPKTLEILMARRKPVFMVTVKPFSDRVIANIEDRLGISNLTFAPLRLVPEGSIHVAASDCSQPAALSPPGRRARRAGSFGPKRFRAKSSSPFPAL